MGDTVNNEGTQKKSFINGIKAEFAKIIWPDKETITKETIAVMSASIALGLIIAILDIIIKYGLNYII
jgi:preprotein translocase subunit SecE